MIQLVCRSSRKVIGKNGTDNRTVKTVVVFTAVLTSVGLLGWYVQRNRKMRREISKSCKDCESNNDVSD
ncbi:hypothetical protein QTP88_012892 [Uroleucon formosanum]